VPPNATFNAGDRMKGRRHAGVSVRVLQVRLAPVA
jgi:hypothetical protein